MRKLRWWFFNTSWLVRCRLQRIRCWLTRHKEVWSSGYDQHPDYCDRCYMEWPQDASTLYKALNRWYGWMVEKDWRWFRALDEWLFDHPRVLRRMPSWWSY